MEENVNGCFFLNTV